jgi:hypothetical protein
MHEKKNSLFVNICLLTVWYIWLARNIVNVIFKGKVSVGVVMDLDVDAKVPVAGANFFY